MTNELPDSYVDDMPCDPDLLEPLGRVTWAAVRLHHGIRDGIDRLHGQAPSNKPFDLTLGEAVKKIRNIAAAKGCDDVVCWADEHGTPAVVQRNKVVHAVTFTATDGKQAIGSRDNDGELRYGREELYEVTKALIHASMTLPA